MNAEVKRLMKGLCAEQGKDVSDVTEKLYIEVLTKAKRWPLKKKRH